MKSSSFHSPPQSLVSIPNHRVLRAPKKHTSFVQLPAGVFPMPMATLPRVFGRTPDSRMPLKKRRIVDSAHPSIVSKKVVFADPPETVLERQVASCWSAPRSVLKHPSSGKYRYSDRFVVSDSASLLTTPSVSTSWEMFVDSPIQNGDEDEELKALKPIPTTLPGSAFEVGGAMGISSLSLHENSSLRTITPSPLNFPTFPTTSSCAKGTVPQGQKGTARKIKTTPSKGSSRPVQGVPAHSLSGPSTATCLFANVDQKICFPSPHRCHHGEKSAPHTPPPAKAAACQSLPLQPPAMLLTPKTKNTAMVKSIKAPPCSKTRMSSSSARGRAHHRRHGMPAIASPRDTTLYTEEDCPWLKKPEIYCTANLKKNGKAGDDTAMQMVDDSNTSFEARANISFTKSTCGVYSPLPYSPHVYNGVFQSSPSPRKSTVPPKSAASFVPPLPLNHHSHAVAQLFSPVQRKKNDE